jgi:hypothetical protein
MLGCDFDFPMFTGQLTRRRLREWLRHRRGAGTARSVQQSFGQSAAIDLPARQKAEESDVRLDAVQTPSKNMRRFSLTHDGRSGWTLTGTASKVPAHFSDLSHALSFARADAAGGEAEVELWVDGYYIFVHQAEGWPHPICAPSEPARRHK